jgi:hypothetical protein
MNSFCILPIIVGGKWPIITTTKGQKNATAAPILSPRSIGGIQPAGMQPISA